MPSSPISLFLEPKMKTCERDGQEYPSRLLTGQITVNALPTSPPEYLQHIPRKLAETVPLVPRPRRFGFFRITFRNHGPHKRINPTRMMWTTSVELWKNRRVLAHSYVCPLLLQALRMHSSADPRCPSKCSQLSDDTRGIFTAWLPCQVLIMPIACVDKFVVNMRYIAERKGVLVNALGYYWRTEPQVVELFDHCGLNVTRA